MLPPVFEDAQPRWCNVQKRDCTYLKVCPTSLHVPRNWLLWIKIAVFVFLSNCFPTWCLAWCLFMDFDCLLFLHCYFMLYFSSISTAPFILFNTEVKTDKSTCWDCNYLKYIPFNTSVGWGGHDARIIY